MILKQSRNFILCNEQWGSITKYIISEYDHSLSIKNRWYFNSQKEAEDKFKELNEDK